MSRRVKKKVVIVGGFGRDFHVFNVAHRDNGEETQVVGFVSAGQLPVDLKRYPAALSGPQYPDGIKIYSMNQLEKVLHEHKVDQVEFAYSDVSLGSLGDVAARTLACGASFKIVGQRESALKAHLPVIAVVGTRTGAGKSQTSRFIVRELIQLGVRAIVVRHPMPYGLLEKQRVQRYAKVEDLAKHQCTIEEMEEYESHLKLGTVLYAGVDYGAILSSIQQNDPRAQVIVWDGGNNDLPFFLPDLTITVADALRPSSDYVHGQANIYACDAVVLNKLDSASFTQANEMRRETRKANPRAVLIEALSPVQVASTQDQVSISGKRCLCIEDGPTLTHGGQEIGAAFLAATKYGAAQVVDPKPFLKGQIRSIVACYPTMGPILPCIGYSKEQLDDLQQTISACDCDTIIIGTPVDLGRLVDFGHRKTVRATYELQELGTPQLPALIKMKMEDELKTFL